MRCPTTKELSSIDEDESIEIDEDNIDVLLDDTLRL